MAVKSTSGAFKNVSSAYSRYAGATRKISSTAAAIEKAKKQIELNYKKQRERALLWGEVSKYATTVGRNVDRMRDIDRGGKKLGIDTSRTLWESFTQSIFGPSGKEYEMPSGEKVSNSELGLVGSLDNRLSLDLIDTLLFSDDENFNEDGL